MTGQHRNAFVEQSFGRPSGAGGIFEMLGSQGSVRLNGLHPGLLSLLPPGAIALQFSDEANGITVWCTL
jgi:hypothetical protein